MTWAWLTLLLVLLLVTLGGNEPLPEAIPPEGAGVFDMLLLLCCLFKETKGEKEMEKQRERKNEIKMP